MAKFTKRVTSSPAQDGQRPEGPEHRVAREAVAREHDERDSGEREREQPAHGGFLWRSSRRRRTRAGAPAADRRSARVPSRTSMLMSHTDHDPVS